MSYLGHTGYSRCADLFVSLAVEGRIPAQQNVQDHATTPQVALVVIAALQHFRCNVIRRSILLCHLHTWCKRTSCAKVNDGDSCLLSRSIKEQVLRLEISVHDIPCVTVVDGTQHLLDDVCCVLLAKVLLLSDPLEELTAIA